jgi:hypothetical protein
MVDSAGDGGLIFAEDERLIFAKIANISKKKYNNA